MKFRVVDGNLELWSVSQMFDILERVAGEHVMT